MRLCLLMILQKEREEKPIVEDIVMITTIIIIDNDIMIEDTLMTTIIVITTIVMATSPPLTMNQIIPWVAGRNIPKDPILTRTVLTTAVKHLMKLWTTSLLLLMIRNTRTTAT